MGGHGGLNILPQKKWNVYRHDRQYQVKFDEHRDIEKKLKEKDRIKRERLTDSLVELRRRAQDSQNKDLDLQPKSKRRSSSSKKEKRSNLEEKAEYENENDTKDQNLEVYEKKHTGHINFFEREEKEAEELNNKRRELLIKSGHYIYNSDFKGPKTVNVFVDDENVKVTPDFKKQETPWYMKPKSSVTYYSEFIHDNSEISGNSPPLESKDKKHRKTKEELRNERLSRESSERQRALALLKFK